MNLDRRRRFDLQRRDGLAVFKEQARLDVLGQHVTRNADGDWPLIFGERALDVPNRIRNQELDSIRFRLARREREARRSVPGLRVLPFIFGVGLTVDHPFVETFKSDSSRRGIGEYRRCAPPPLVVENRVVSLEGRFAFGDNLQRRTVSVESGYMEMSRVLTDAGIVKRTDRVGLLERAIVEHIIKVLRDAQRSVFYGLRRLVR